MGRCSLESSSGRFVFCKIKPQTIDYSNLGHIISVPEQSARERGLQKEVLVYVSYVSKYMAMYEQVSQQWLGVFQKPFVFLAI